MGISEWEKVETIGTGAFGTVYKVKRETGGYTQFAALKEIRFNADSDFIYNQNEYASAEEYNRHLVSTLMNEVQTLDKLKGRTNIVSYEDHEAVCDEDGNWIVRIRMELLTPLKEYVKDRTLSQQEVVKIGSDLCSALEICEKLNIVHRDVKLENVFVNDNGDFKLGDFGTAKVLRDVQTHYTSTGTLSYMAPEVLMGSRYDSRADQYSLGVLLYSLLNDGKMPEKKGGAITEPPAHADKIRAQAILKACSKDKNDRFAHIADFRAALTAESHGTGKKKSALAAVSIVVVCLAISAVLYRFATRPTDETTTAATETTAGPVEMSDDLFDYTFRLDGVVYKLPARFSDFYANGWNRFADGKTTPESIVAGGNTNKFFVVRKGDATITLYANNHTGDAKALQDCAIFGIEVTADSGADFQLAKGITCFSSPKEIVNAFGTPGKNDVQSFYTSIEYYEDEWYNFRGVKFLLYDYGSTFDGRSQITVENMPSAPEVISDVKTNRPDYLSDYRPPEELGGDLTAGTFEADGKLYQLPVPVEQFTASGWTLWETPKSIYAGMTGDAVLKKGASSLMVKLTNYALYETVPENCVVSCLSVDDSSNAAVFLPGRIAPGTAWDDCLAQAGVDDAAIQNDRFTVQSDGQSSIRCTVTLSQDGKTVGSMTVDASPSFEDDVFAKPVFAQK